MVPKKSTISWAVSGNACNSYWALQKKGSLELRLITGA